MIIHDFHVVGISVPKPKANAPGTVYRDCPLTSSVALERVQSHTLERADVIQPSGRVQNCQQFQRSILRIELRES